MPTDLMHRRHGPALAIAVVVLAAFCALASGSAAAERRVDATSGMGAFEAAVVARINEVRDRKGLRGLRLSRHLAASADFHSRDMGRRGYFSHKSADGTAFWKRIQRFYSSRGSRSWAVGENLLWGSNTFGAAFAVRQWMKSPSHRRNMLSGAWREIGVGAIFFAHAPGDYGGRPVTIVTADFGAR